MNELSVNHNYWITGHRPHQVQTFVATAELNMKLRMTFEDFDTNEQRT